MLKAKIYTSFRGFFMLLVCSSLIFSNSCRKAIDEPATPLPYKENISMDEVVNWGTAINNRFAKPVNMRFDKAQKTFYNNTFYIRVPVDSSTGYFYFIKTPNGLQPMFIRYHASGNVGEGWAEFIDFNTRKFYKALTYKNYQPDQQYTLTNSSLFFDFFFAPATPTARKAANTQKEVSASSSAAVSPTVGGDITITDPNACPLIDPATLIPLLDFYNKNVNTGGVVKINDVITDFAQYLSGDKPGKTDCTKQKGDFDSVSGDDKSGFFSWIGGIFGSIGEFFGGLFGSWNDNGDGSNSNNTGDNPFPNILLDNGNLNNSSNNSNPLTSYNGNNPAYGVNGPTPPVWQQVDPNVSKIAPDPNNPLGIAPLDNNYISLSNTKLCQSYNFVPVGNSWTATINNLSWKFGNAEAEYIVTFSSSCLSIPNYNITPAEASVIFNNAFNGATTEILELLKSKAILPSQVRLTLKGLIQFNLTLLKPGATWSSTGPCSGFVPITTIDKNSFCD